MAEAVIEVIVDRAWEVFKEVASINSEFKEQFERLWAVLRPLLDEQTTESEFEDLRSELERCGELVNKCAKVSSWNIVQKNSYSNMLKKQGKKIEVLIQTATFWNTKEIISRLDESMLPPMLGRVFGIENPLKDLKGRLRLHQVVGVYGMGGCGKTTLAKALCHDSDVKTEYGERAWVSNKPDQLETICQRLLRKSNEMASTSKNKANVSGRRRKMLIVLDDVWSDNNDIDVLVEVMKEKAADSRILITSRAKLHICDASYSVDQLSEDDARKIFEHHASSGNPQTSWKPEKELIDEIVRGCEGHPLALKVIGGYLKDYEERIWRLTANRLKQKRGVSSVRNGDKIIQCLSTSLTSLSKKDRQCFFDLGYFPQSQTIPASAIIDMWTETRDLLHEDDAYEILSELGGRNLVELVDRTSGGVRDPDGSFGSLSISQHDLLRELAICESKTEGKSEIIRLFIENREVKIPKAWTLENGRTTQAKLVSINTGDMKNSDWPDLDLPNAEVLILNFSASSYYLPTFLRGMKNLKVLVVANHGCERAELHGLSLLSSMNKLKRVMFRKIILFDGTMHNVEGGSSSITIGAFREPPQELQKLSLVLCDIRHM